MTIAAGFVLLVICAVTRATAEKEAPSTCPPPDPKCECKLTNDDSGCPSCMCHEPVPPTSCPRVRCPVPKENEECTVQDENGCQVCTCTSVPVPRMSTAI